MIIQNNNIYINRGEEATFRATIYMSDGTPFRLLKPKEGKAPHDVIYFTVKKDAYTSDLGVDDGKIIRYELDMDKLDPANKIYPVKKFVSYDAYELGGKPKENGEKITPADDTDFNLINTNGEDVIYYYVENGKRTFYYVKTKGSTTDTMMLEKYVFDLSFVIPTDDTKQLFAKTYYWELDWVSTPAGTDVSKKIPLITPSQFVVGGSIYD